MTAIAPTDRLKSFRNRCVIERFRVSLCYFDFHCLLLILYLGVFVINCVRSIPFSLRALVHVVLNLIHKWFIFFLMYFNIFTFHLYVLCTLHVSYKTYIILNIVKPKMYFLCCSRCDINQKKVWQGIVWVDIFLWWFHSMLSGNLYCYLG